MIEKSKPLIKSLTNKIASFPSDIDPRVKAKEQHSLSVGQAYVEIELEKDRVCAVVAKHEEQYPPHQIECPICLEDVKVMGQYSIQYFVCCYKSICCKCAQSKGGREMKTCPMCRAPELTEEWNERVVNRLKRGVARGVASAQTMMAGYYLGFSSPDNVATNVEEGVRMMQLAAESGDPFSLTQMAYFRKIGLYGIERDLEIANEMLTTAANNGFCAAQSSLAFSYSRKEDYTMAVLYATLASRSAHHDNQIHPAQLLGKFFYLGVGGLEKNLCLAQFYLEISEKYSSGNMTNHLILAKTLLELSEKNYGTRHPPAGYSSIPRVLYLLSKSIDRDEDNPVAQELIKELKIQNKCANCGREAESMPAKKLKQCAVCEAVSYCSRDCQVKHWKDGHKSDCVKKFRPLEGLARCFPPGTNLENSKLICPDGKLIDMKDFMQAQP